MSVQEVVTTLNMYQDLISNLPSIVFVLFLGSWSDKNGRKIPLILPFIGSAMKSVIYLVSFKYDIKLFGHFQHL